jgi:hypothetical protein
MPTEDQRGGSQYNLHSRLESLEHKVEERRLTHDKFEQLYIGARAIEETRLAKYDVFIGQIQTSLRLIVVAINVISLLLFSFLVWEYTQFSTIRDAVLTHHALDVIRTEQQKEINESLQSKVELLIAEQARSDEILRRKNILQP